ncbi:hypothetical protein B0H13DRAFT_2300365 [Mycena leptocephala]|nr:hypothetical protein B0H13DRAFT_2300365 [Mycena leptocephala]
MSGSALVAPSKDPAGLLSIYLEEQIALLGPSKPAKEQISTSMTAIQKKCQLAVTESIPEDAFPELKMAYPPFGLPFEVPRGHRVYALTLNGTVVSFLASPSGFGKVNIPDDFRDALPQLLQHNLARLVYLAIDADRTRGPLPCSTLFMTRVR